MLLVATKATTWQRPHSLSGLVLKKGDLRTLKPVAVAVSPYTYFVTYPKSIVSDSFQRCLQLHFFQLYIAGVCMFASLGSQRGGSCFVCFTGLISASVHFSALLFWSWCKPLQIWEICVLMTLVLNEMTYFSFLIAFGGIFTNVFCSITLLRLSLGSYAGNNDTTRNLSLSWRPLKCDCN